jgi:hypothetical protein
MFFDLLLSNEPFYIFLGSDSIHGSSDSFIFGKKARLARVSKFETRPATSGQAHSGLISKTGFLSLITSKVKTSVPTAKNNTFMNSARQHMSPIFFYKRMFSRVHCFSVATLKSA